MTDFDVVIVGGGISGLSVADGLSQAGRSVRLFEARSRLGGRIDSTPVAGGGNADLGPTWFWPGERRMEALVDELGIAVHQQWTAGDALMTVGGQTQRAGGFSVPPSYRFSGGAMELVNRLAGRLPANVVALESPVSNVERRPDGLVVHGELGAVSAAAVVVALPPSLAVDSGLLDPVDLEPALFQAASIVPVWMGGITKAVAVYQRSFWRENGLSGMVSALGGPFREIHDMSGPGGKPGMLFGFGQSQPQGPELSAQRFVEQLVSLFGPEAGRPMEAMAVDWRQERFTTPATWPLSMRYDLFGAPAFQRPTWDGRLHWSSTETSTEAPGHIEGALAAAERTLHALGQ